MLALLDFASFQTALSIYLTFVSECPPGPFILLRGEPAASQQFFQSSNSIAVYGGDLGQLVSVATTLDYQGLRNQWHRIINCHPQPEVVVFGRL